MQTISQLISAMAISAQLPQSRARSGTSELRRPDELLAPSPLIDTELIAAVHFVSLGVSSSAAAFIHRKIKGYRFLARELETCARYKGARRLRLARALAACESMLQSYLSSDSPLRPTL
jgi:hypothetical protein